MPVAGLGICFFVLEFRRSGGDIFIICKDKQQAFKKIATWCNDVAAEEIDAFKTVATSVKTHCDTILNFFDNRSINASAMSFNAKVKAFRATLRSKRSIMFFCSGCLNGLFPDF
ncbi:transposase [Mucilaginibacter sp.]|uniref:transposase n=1 Tax=Mucilaginibacter sp. TaxID=1882438 RepID=UPI00261D0155|nr:transposase [Mucilaginibacter sp.]